MCPTIIGDNDLKKVTAGSKVSWQFKVSSSSAQVKFSFSVIAGPDAENAPEWAVTLNDADNGECWCSDRGAPEIDIEVPGNVSRQFNLVVECPKGVRYGDSVTTEISVSDDMGTDSMCFEAIAQQSIMILKTQMDKEVEVARALASKANIGEKDVYSVLSPAGLRGYVFVEGMNTDRLREKTRDIKKARSFIDGETSIEEISPYLIPVSAVGGFVEGDIVELVSGPFKGEHARVQSIDQSKEEITVELIDAMVPIPVTVKGDSVRVIEKEK